MSRKLPEDIFNFTVIFKTLKIVWSASKKHTIVRILLIFANAILPLIPLYLFKLLLDAFSTGEPVIVNDVLYILGGLGGLSLFMILIKNIASYNNSIQSDIITDYMSALLIGKSLKIDLEFYDSDKYHDQFNRAMSQGGTTPITTLTAVTTFFQNLATLLAVVILLFTLHWSIIFILFIITLPVALVRFVYSEKLVELIKIQTQAKRTTGYYKNILTGAGAAKEVRMFSFGKYMLRKFLNLASNLRKERRTLYFKQLRWVSLAQSTEVIATIAALCFIVYKAIHGNMTVGDISFYYLTFQKGQGNVSGLLSSAIQIHKQKLTLNFLYEYLEMDKKVINPITPVPIPNRINSLDILNVNFKYPETSNFVLRNINLSVNKGDIVAIVGENGSGKTTLVKLINRLYDPTDGSIRFNGTDIKNFLIENVRRKTTVIFQDFTSYALTVKENISLSNVFQKPDIKRIREAAKYAEANTFIENLPLKYNTQLKRIFKNGHELSKGQWQKIALARAFYKNGDIIILDEPTSFIDPIAEANIFDNFKKVAKEKILFLVTHRIYNLKLADKILVMDKGQIVEQGSHQELIEIDGLYKKMFDKQDIT